MSGGASVGRVAWGEATVSGEAARGEALLDRQDQRIAGTLDLVDHGGGAECVEELHRVVDRGVEVYFLFERRNSDPDIAAG